jgi:uncharacterized protein (TIGR03437 family)
MKNLRFAILALLAAVPAVAQTPAITTVVEAAGQTPPGFPNDGLPPGGIIRITGTNLGPQTSVDSYPAFPLETAIGGVSVRVRSGQTDYAALMMSAQATSVFAVVPSEVPLGNATITVTVSGRASAPYSARIADVAGIFTLNARAAGPALILNSRFEPVTLLNPARPGEMAMVILNASTPAAPAGSAALADDLLAGRVAAARREPTAPSFGELYIRDQVAPVLLLGRLFAGLAFAVFQVPTRLPEACWASLYFRNAGGIRSNVATMSIGDPSRGVCVDPIGPSMRDLFAKSRPGLFPFSLLDDEFDLLDFKRDYGGSVQVGTDELLYNINFYVRGRIRYPVYKDIFQTSHGCYIDYFFRPRPTDYPDTEFLNLGAVRLSRGGSSELIDRNSSFGTYTISGPAGPWLPTGAIRVDANTYPGVPGGLHADFTFPYAIPSVPIQMAITGNTVNASEDLRIRLMNLPNRPDHHVMVTLNVPLAHLNAGVNIICRYEPAAEVLIPKEFLGMVPDGGTNQASLTTVYQSNRPYPPGGVLPGRIGIADVSDRLYRRLANLAFRNAALR